MQIAGKSSRTVEQNLKNLEDNAKLLSVILGVFFGHENIYQFLIREFQFSFVLYVFALVEE